MNDPIKVSPGEPCATIFTNESDVVQVVTIKDGPLKRPDPLGRQRVTRLLLEPGEARSVERLNKGFETTSTTDTSSMQGELTLIGGCGDGCMHGAD